MSFGDDTLHPDNQPEARPRAITDDDLDLMELDRLINVLARRYDEFVFAGVSKTGQKREGYNFRWSTSNLRTLGLAHHLADAVSSTISQITIQNPEDT